MSELYKIILTSSLTVFGGIVVFVAGQVIVKFLIEPFQNYRKLVGEIASSLIYNANASTSLHDVYLTQLEEAERKDGARNEMVAERLRAVIKSDYHRLDDARRTFREQASRLMGTTNMIPMYGLWSFLQIVPKREDIIAASAHLISLSNSVGEAGTERRQNIAERLRIKVLSEKFSKAG